MASSILIGGAAGHLSFGKKYVTWAVQLPWSAPSQAIEPLHGRLWTWGFETDHRLCGFPLWILPDNPHLLSLAHMRVVPPDTSEKDSDSWRRI